MTPCPGILVNCVDTTAEKSNLLSRAFLKAYLLFLMIMSGVEEDIASFPVKVASHLGGQLFSCIRATLS